MAADWYGLIARDLLDQSQDPRVGSTRNDSSGGGTLSTSSGNKSNSLAKLGATFGPVGAYLGVCLLCFIVLRPRFKRVFAPKTIPGLRGAEAPTPELPNGLVNWIIPFFKVPDTYVLNYGSLDAFFFLRFIKVLRNICFAGCIIVWPILFPVHVNGGNKLDQLEQLTMGNVTSGSSKLWANAVTAWLFFGFVLFTIVRECIYFINLRQAYLSAPFYADRLSSKTMLLLCVPQEYRDEARLRKLYGDSARRIFVPRSSKALAKLVKEREQTALRLEKAEIDLIKKANLARNKHYHTKVPVKEILSNPEFYVKTAKKVKPMKTLKLLTMLNAPVLLTMAIHKLIKVLIRRLLRRKPKFERYEDSPTQSSPSSPPDSPPSPPTGLEGQESPGDVPKSMKEGDQTDKVEEKDVSETEYKHPYGLRPDLPDVRGSVAAQWIPAEDRPFHRPLGNWGRRVDTIRWCRRRLKELNLLIFKMRREIRRGNGEALPAAFIEFDTQEAAVAAQQVVVHHRPLQMAPPLLYIRPEDVVWEVLRMKWWERIIRRLLVMCLISAAIIFWSIPSAFISIVSSIDTLTKVVFLKWVGDLPSFIKGLIGGFLPPALLSMLMSLVPAMLRFCAAQAGIPSLVVGELFTQNAYFAFQVVQVFLITTLTSAASGALESILEQPLSAQKLLAENLPKASNFYLSYILIQCLAIGATGLLQVWSVVRHSIVANMTDNPRVRYERWRTLKPARWGALYPVFTNLGVIALSYACIAPLILIFCAVGMAFLRFVWKYNLIYVFDTSMDSKGLFYPRALQHLIVGLYLAEICLVGLLGLGKAFGSMGLTVALLIFTALIHINLREAIAPLTRSLPQTLAIEEEIQEEERAKAAKAKASEGQDDSAGTAASYYDIEEAFGDEEIEVENLEEEEEEEHTVGGTRAIEGLDSVRSAITDWLKSWIMTKLKIDEAKGGIMAGLKEVRSWFRKSRKFYKDHKPDYSEKPPNFLAKWLHPEEHEDFVALRKLLPKDDHRDISYPEKNNYCTYQPPELWKPKPTLWIPRDDARVSRQEVAHTSLSVPITDRGATLNTGGVIKSDLDAAPFVEPRFLL